MSHDAVHDAVSAPVAVTDAAPVAAPVPTTPDSEICHCCEKHLKNTSTIRLPCGDEFHILCFSNRLEYQYNATKDIHAIVVDQNCPKCGVDFKINLTKFNFETKHPSLIYMYEKMLRIPRLQCMAMTHIGHQCNNLEYPFNGGYCKHHLRSSLHQYEKEDSEKIIKVFSAIFLNKHMMQNHTQRLKIFVMIIFYSEYVLRQPNWVDLLKNFDQLYETFNQVLKKYPSAQQMYEQNGMYYSKYLLNKATYFIEK